LAARLHFFFPLSNPREWSGLGQLFNLFRIVARVSFPFFFFFFYFFFIFFLLSIAFLSRFTPPHQFCSPCRESRELKSRTATSHIQRSLFRRPVGRKKTTTTESAALWALFNGANVDSRVRGGSSQSS
jgi:hypothetical protein